MKLPTWAKVRDLFFPPAELDERATDRSEYERFAIPYTFKPQLSLGQAILAAVMGFLRIFLGCVLFGFWGAYTLVAWGAIQNSFLRVMAMLPLLLLFPLLLGLLMLGISALTRLFISKRT